MAGVQGYLRLNTVYKIYKAWQRGEDAACLLECSDFEFFGVNGEEQCRYCCYM
jgi:hypothetical protein